MQFMCASTNPPHLKAIFPSMATFDLYRVIYAGGVFAEKAARGISQSLWRWDVERPSVPVDADTTRELEQRAREEHRANADPYELLSSFPFRDTCVEDLVFWVDRNVYTNLETANGAAVPVYLWAGWRDFLIRESFLWFANLEVPKKLTVGPWSHGSHDWYDLLAIEELRWFDYWLKGIDNGIMDEPPINFAIEHLDSANTWHQVSAWPPPETQQRRWYCRSGPAGAVRSVNDGLLDLIPPAEESGCDTYVVDYSCSSDLDDLRTNDEKGLTYTTAPLERDLILVGHPVIRLHISSSAEDVDLFAYLEDVDEEGVSTLKSDGVLRASHRTQADPPFDNLSLPYHRHFEEDVSRVPPDAAVELAFDLLPLSVVIPAGHRIRLTITCADRSHAEPVEKDQVPPIRLHRNRRYPSSIQLPVFGQPSAVPEEG
jgi:predicted acyl esterase